MDSLLNLLNKYNIPGGRYTYFPFHRGWNNALTKNEWISQFALSKKTPIDLYIHIPFCHSLCTFCGCNIRVLKNNSENNDYLTALKNEWALYPSDTVVDTLFLGGGTPNFLSPRELKNLIHHFTFTKNKLITIEIDPRGLRLHDLDDYKEMGITHLSIGIQDFNEQVLKSVNRTQSEQHIQNLVKKAKELKFEKINGDFIYGLPQQTLDSFKETLLKAIKLDLDMITLYPKAQVPWQQDTQAAFGTFKEYGLSEMNEFFSLSADMLVKAHYHYLGMGTFVKGPKDHYQRTIMGPVERKNSTTIGLGVSAISTSEIGHIQNDKIYSKYILDQKAVYKTHLKSNEENELENFYHQILTNKKFKALNKAFVSTERLNLLDKFVHEKLLVKDGDQYMLTQLGLYFQKAILQIFDPHFNFPSIDG